MHKELSNTYVELLTKVYNYLLDSYYNCLFAIDLKHAYYIISLHQENKYYFAFTISNID